MPIKVSLVDKTEPRRKYVEDRLMKPSYVEMKMGKNFKNRINIHVL